MSEKKTVYNDGALALRTYQRICKNNSCSRCPLCDKIGENACSAYTASHLDILQKWLDENPEPHEKTIAEDFFERCPGAESVVETIKRPVTCAREVGYKVVCSDSTDCRDCWQQPLKEHDMRGESDGDTK